MNQERRSLQVGAVVLAAAVILRLVASGALDSVVLALTKPETVAVLMYLETGRVLRSYNPMDYPGESVIPDAVDSAASAPAPATVPTATFLPEDLKLAEVEYDCSYTPDLESLLLCPLDWDLADGTPRVLILHTHTTESYTRSEGEDYTESSDYRTLDERYNMISIGDALAKRLEEAGIGVVHDRTLHDYPSYNGSYADARETIEEYLAEYPSISMVLDIHRDAADTPSGQMATSATVDGQTAAQLMLVVGTDAGGLDHPNWQENLSLALKLHVQLEKKNPGLCRPIDLRSERFNADESPGALLVEVGAAGNTHGEAVLAATALADGIIALAKGANITADSTS